MSGSISYLKMPSLLNGLGALSVKFAKLPLHEAVKFKDIECTVRENGYTEEISKPAISNFFITRIINNTDFQLNNSIHILKTMSPYIEKNDIHTIYKNILNTSVIDKKSMEKILILKNFRPDVFIPPNTDIFKKKSNEFLLLNNGTEQIIENKVGKGSPLHEYEAFSQILNNNTISSITPHLKVIKGKLNESVEDFHKERRKENGIYMISGYHYLIKRCQLNESKNPGISFLHNENKKIITNFMKEELGILNKHESYQYFINKLNLNKYC